MSEERGPEADREVLYRGAILDLVRLDGRWDVVEHLPGVAVLVRDGSRVLGVWQHRHAAGTRTWELPAGLVDPGETPEETAHRELAEEAGLDGRLELITRMYTSPGFTDEVIHLFEATETVPAQGEPDETEDLEVAWLDAREAWEAIRDGRIASSAPTVVGLSWLLARSED